MTPSAAIPCARDLLWWALFGAGVAYTYTWIDRMAHGLMIADREHMEAASTGMHILGFCRKRCRLLIAIHLHDLAT